MEGEKRGKLRRSEEDEKREVKAQGRHEEEGEKTTRGESVEGKADDAKHNARRQRRVEQTHDFVAKSLVDSHRRRTELADRKRPSTNVACSHQSSPGRRRTD